MLVIVIGHRTKIDNDYEHEHEIRQQHTKPLSQWVHKEEEYNRKESSDPDTELRYFVRGRYRHRVSAID
ncbi:MAG: hypothetical protein ACQETH_12575 [Candidatus Rifleibacteriota bacterium]